MAAAIVFGSVLGAGAAVLHRTCRTRFSIMTKSANLEDRSTTSSAGGGTAAYETRKAVEEYLQFHFGKDEDILPYENGPKVVCVTMVWGGAQHACMLDGACGTHGTHHACTLDGACGCMGA